MRDLRMIGFKLKYVLLPRMREEKGKEMICQRKQEGEERREKKKKEKKT